MVLLADPGAVLDALQGHLESAPMQRQLVDRAGQMAKSLPGLSRPDLRVFIVRIASRIQVHNDRVEITLDPVELLMLLGGSQGNPATADLEGMAPIVLTVEARLKRTGIEKRMVLGNGLEAATADPSLLRLIARAHGIRKRLFDYTTLSLKEIAKEEDVVGSYVTRLLRLSFLAPDIVAAILKTSPTAAIEAMFASPPERGSQVRSLSSAQYSRSNAPRGFSSPSICRYPVPDLAQLPDVGDARFRITVGLLEFPVCH